MIIKRTTVENLSSEARAWLISLNEKAGDMPNDPGIPVYLRQGDDFFFIENFVLKSKANRNFEAGAATHGLYRGGAVVIINCLLKYKVSDRLKALMALLVVPDERYGWAKPVAGIANFSEGLDLTKAGRRELGEEAFIFTLDPKNRKRIVPKGLMNAPMVNSLGLEAVQCVEIGEVLIDHYAVNEKNRGLEAVMRWELDISEPFSYTHNEDWWQGGHSGITAYAIDPQTKQVIGVFSGQQGFVPITSYGIHPTLLSYIEQQS